MNDPAAIARMNALSVEAKLTGHAKRSDGGLNLRFMIHPHGIPQALKDAAIGDRYVLALVEVDDNDQPVPIKNDATGLVASRDGGADTIGLAAPPPALRDKRLAQQAGRCCKDPVFLRFLKEVRAINDDGDAPLFVRRFCAVDSRADILPGTEAGEAWDSLYSRFIAWRDHPDIPLADCQRERV